MKFSEVRVQIQELLKGLGFYTGRIDGNFGPQTYQALHQLDLAEEESAPVPGAHRVKASSFADPADVQAYQQCRARGGSEQQCYKLGDNGIGLWGDRTTAEVPMCALPREDWEKRWGKGAAARGKQVAVTANGKTVICELRDTMPRRANIRNGAGIDLNPAAVQALGLRPPILVSATWEWADDLVAAT